MGERTGGEEREKGGACDGKEGKKSGAGYKRVKREGESEKREAGKWCCIMYVTV